MGALLLSVLCACAADETRSRRGRTPSVDRPEVARPRHRWRHWQQLEALRIVATDVRSSHLVGEPPSTIRAGGDDHGYGRPHAVLPAGALLVVSHATTDGLLHFAMERPAAPGPTAGASPWMYTVVDEAGWIVEEGRIATCVRCHAEAQTDEVFGPLVP